MNYFQISIIIASVSLTRQYNTEVNACPGNLLLPAVSINENGKNVCEDGSCTVYPGGQINMDLNFTSPGYFEHIKPQVLVKALGKTIDFPVFPTDGCEGLMNTVCPIVESEFITYTFSMYLPGLLPRVSIGLQFSIIDDDTNRAVVCFAIDLNVQY